MSTPILSAAPVADPNFPALSPASTSPLVASTEPFTMAEVADLESILWYWEEYSPYSRSQDTTGRIPDINLDLLTSIRAKLAGMKPATS